MLVFYISKTFTAATNEVITNDVRDSYQYIYVIAHIIYNHPIYLEHS
jgi:hypothetical protein